MLVSYSSFFHAYYCLTDPRPEQCRSRIEECNSLRCPYGITRNYDQDGCERCECENPCRGYNCPEDSQCAVDIQADSQSGSTFAPVCRKSNLPIYLCISDMIVYCNAVN